jgi:hypothetical protein
MTAETLTLNPIASLAALIPSGSAALLFADAAAATPLDLAPKKPSYGYDEPSEDDDGYDEEDEDDEDEDGDDDEEDDDYSYDDDEEEEDYDEDEDEDEEDEDDEEEDDDDEEDDDIGYYTLSKGSASGGGMNRVPLQ